MHLTPAAEFAGKAWDTRVKHRRALRRMQDMLAADGRLRAMSFATAVVAVHRRLGTGHWKAASFHREMANFAGAMKDLPLYSNSPIGFQLGREPVFEDAMKAAKLQMNAESVDTQPAATLEQLRAAVRLAPDLPAKAALALTWMCAGRTGDVLKTKRKELLLAEDFATSGDMQIVFCRGKGARFSQPYTVPTRMPAEWRSLIQQYVASMRPGDWLFPGPAAGYMAAIGSALRSATAADFTVRSIRRGALQAMADAGVSEETMLLFSGHKSVDTLMRYLQWGQHAGKRTEAAQAAAQFLGAPATGQQVPRVAPAAVQRA